jgi:hypothetical protein
MLLERVDAQKKSFTLKFADTDVVSVAFGSERWGYNEMRVDVSKKDEDDSYTERFELRYNWNSELEETPAFVMDMMSLIHKIGKMTAEIKEEILEQTAEEEVEETEDKE